jgi:hypothetical protein
MWKEVELRQSLEEILPVHIVQEDLLAPNPLGSFLRVDFSLVVRAIHVALSDPTNSSSPGPRMFSGRSATAPSKLFVLVLRSGVTAMIPLEVQIPLRLIENDKTEPGGWVGQVLGDSGTDKFSLTDAISRVESVADP